MSDELFEVITKEVFEDFQNVQSSGAVNMADYRGVMAVSKSAELHHLYELGRSEYYAILKNYDKLTKEYGKDE